MLENDRMLRSAATSTVQHQLYISGVSVLA